jgi:hypothetical protein
MTGKTYFTIKQTTKRREFLEFIQHYYDQDNFFTKIRDFQQGKYFTSELSSPSTYEIGEQRKRWYPNGIKIVPKDLKLNAAVIAFWMQGDGDAGKGGKNGNSVTVNFSTNSFTFDDVTFLRDQLQELKIEANLKLKRGKEHLISISKASEIKKLMDMIKPYILGCFQYKIQYPNLIDFGDQVEKQRTRQAEYYHSLSPEQKKEKNHNQWEKVKEKRNPERKDKYHSNSEYRQECIDRANKNYIPHPRIRENLEPCHYCKSENVRKSGKIINKSGTYQRFRCNLCQKLYHSENQLVIK